MKSALKSMARGLWRCGGPVRRPLARKIEAVVASAVARVFEERIQGRLDGLIARIDSEAGESGSSRDETNLLLDSLVREVTRLQDEVEALRVRPVDPPAADGRAEWEGEGLSAA